MILYLSGPMSGVPLHNIPAFNAAANGLRLAGYTVMNPAEWGEEGMSWEEFLQDDLKVLLDCQGVATLDNWFASRGARLEVHVATELGKPVRPVSSWLALAKVSGVTEEGVVSTTIR